MSLSRGAVREDAARIHNGVLASQEKEQRCATCSAVDGPRGSIQMEVRQKEKKEHHTVTCVCEI